MTELYPNFPSRWERSQVGVRYIAEKLWEEGDHNIFIPLQILAKTLANARACRDDGDILLLTEPRDLRVEAKWLESTAFTGLEDYPWVEFMICEKRSFDPANPKPDFYIIMEKFKRAVGIVDVNTTRKYWYWKHKVDKSRMEDGERPYYHCTLNHVKWHKFK